MKKIVTAALLCIAVSGTGFASGLDFHIGAGWHSSFFGDVDEVPGFGPAVARAKVMPLGIGGYAGIGFGGLFNLGLEIAPSWVFNLAGYKMSNFALQSRIYFKFKIIELVTATAFAGYTLNFAGSPEDPASLVGTPVVGARVTVFIFYAEYALNLTPNFDGIAKNEVGVGVAFFR